MSFNDEDDSDNNRDKNIINNHDYYVYLYPIIIIPN